MPFQQSDTHKLHTNRCLSLDLSLLPQGLLRRLSALQRALDGSTGKLPGKDSVADGQLLGFEVEGFALSGARQM